MKSNLEVALGHKMTRLATVMQEPEQAKLFELAYRLGYRAGVQYGSFLQGAGDKCMTDPAKPRETIRYVDSLVERANQLPYPRFLSLSAALRVARVMLRVHGVADGYRKEKQESAWRGDRTPEKNEDVLDEIQNSKEPITIEVFD